MVLNLGESASWGTGITISTLLAVDLKVNWWHSSQKANVHYLLVWSQPSLELGLRLDHDLDPAVRVPLNHRLDPDQRLGMKYFAREFFNLVLPWRGCWVCRTLVQTPHRGEWRILSCHSQTWIVQVQSQYFKSYWSNTGPGQPNALVKLDIFQLDRLWLATSSRLKEHLKCIG